MKDNRRSSRIRKRKQEVKLECFFCKEEKSPSFLEHEILSKFVSERGKILPRVRTGFCAKHQRTFASEVKRARYLALLPYMVSPE